jgi:hypothetical protein
MRRALASIALTAALASPAFAAGDVAVLADAGILTLTGDDTANDLQIDRDPVTRELIVRGRNGTTISGAGELRFADVKSIRAALGVGDDVLALGSLSLSGEFAADLGDGNDSLSFYFVKVRRRVTVTGGAGDDLVTFDTGSDLVRGGVIDTGDGADHVRIADSSVRGRLRIVTGLGDDLVEIHRNGFTSYASLLVRTGAGVDTVDVLGNTFQGDVKIQTDEGEDAVWVTTSRFVRTATVKTGTEDDQIEVERSTFDAAFFVNGGSGTNGVFFIGIHITGSGVSAGGAGHSGNVWWAFVIVHVFP